MNVSVKHNFQEIAQMFESLAQNLNSDIEKKVSSASFGEKVQNIIESEIDKLGFATRAKFLKKSFQGIIAEVTSSGLIYRIFSTSPQATRLNEGAAPSPIYTIGSKSTGDGMYEGISPTGFMDKIQEDTQILIYKEILNAIENSMTKAGF